MKDKIIEKLQKLQELAERGEDYEKENARQRIEEIMAKYGITEEDLGKEDVYYHFTTITTDKTRFAVELWQQVCARVLMNPKARAKVFDDSKEGKKIKKYLASTGIPHNAAAYCTDAQFVQIMAMYEFYERHLAHDEGIFFSAFLLKNNLLVEVSEKEYMDSTTQEQRDRQEKARAMSYSMDEHIFHKQLEQ